MTVDEDMRELKRQTERDVDVLRDHVVAKLNLTAEKIDRAVESYQRERANSEMHHNELHGLQEKNLEEFKVFVREQIVSIMKLLDVARADRNLFVTRDVHDSQLDAIERALLALEKALTEKNELAVEQINEKLHARINANADRITKMEQGISVMNARNQQSIIALGILLTAVEVIMRFFAN
jgi:hypothetical protein